MGGSIIMRMTVARLRFARSREVVDELDWHKLKTEAQGEVRDRPGTNLAMKRSVSVTLVGYSSEEDSKEPIQAPPTKKR